MPREILNIIGCDRCGRGPTPEEESGYVRPNGWAELCIYMNDENQPDAFICSECWPEVKAAIVRIGVVS